MRMGRNQEIFRPTQTLDPRWCLVAQGYASPKGAGSSRGGERRPHPVRVCYSAEYTEIK